MIDLTYEERIQREAGNLRTHWSSSPRWEGIERPFEAEDVIRLRGSITRRAHAGAARRRAPVVADDDQGPRASARRADRRTGRRDGQGRPAGDLRLGLAGGRGREPRRADLPRPVALPGRTACRTSSDGSTTRCSAPTRSRGPMASTGTYWMAPIVADAEAGFGGALNAFELMKAMIESGPRASTSRTSSRARRSAGTSAGRCSSRRRSSSNARRRAAGRRRPRRADGARRADRRRVRDAAHERRRRPTARSSSGERTAEGFFRSATASRPRSRAGSRTRRSPTCCGARRPHPTSRMPGCSPRRSTSGSPASSSPTTARRASTGARIWTTTRSRASSASSGRWATGSSSSRSPGSTR